MDMLTNLRTFQMAARCGSFSKAARNLHVVPSVVAKRVAQLEGTVGAPLFHRTTRSMRLTEEGERFRSRAAELIDSFEAIVHGLKPQETGISGRIRLSAPATLTVFHLNPIFAEFLAMYPNIHLDVLPFNKTTDPSAKGLDMLIGGQAATYEGVTAVPLMLISPVLCASPAYIAARGLPQHPRDLSSHSCLVFRPHGSRWLFQSAQEGLIEVDVSHSHMVADNHLTLLESARAGCGLALIPRNYAEAALADGFLKAVLPDYQLSEDWIHVFIPRSKIGLPRVKLFLEHLKSRMGTLSENAPLTELRTM